ncbi:natural killer cell granule protein 7, partial [Chelydra serpentina]
MRPPLGWDVGGIYTGPLCPILGPAQTALPMPLTPDPQPPALPAPASPGAGGGWDRGRGGAGSSLTLRVPCPPPGYIQATRAFLILAVLGAAAAVLSLLASLTSCVHSAVSTDLLAAISAFAAGSCTLVAMGVYSGESWHRNLDPQIQLSFAWSFYLGWAALPLLGLSGTFALLAH